MTGGTGRFAGKVAVVTGGGSEIGRATCLTLAEGGADVVFVSNVAKQAGAVATELCTLGVKGIARTVDVTDLAAVEALSAEVEKDPGRANIPVTCAGMMGARRLTTETSAAEWSQTVAVNLDGVYCCIKAFLPGMLARDWRRITTLSSVSGKLPAALYSDYAASNHGVIGLTKTIAIELGMLGKNGVNASALCPGPNDTPMMEAIIDHLAPGMNIDCEKFRKVAVEKNIRRRLLDPRRVTSTAAHLTSDKVHRSTGQAINVCGGMVLC
jgi:NAD(P)-dependent dehydrogenase (short-subunit alcohol dehydrogenase family)